MFKFFIFSFVFQLCLEWIRNGCWRIDYRPNIEKGVDSFLEFAIENVKDSNLIPCPCIKCGNLKKIDVKKKNGENTANLEEIYTDLCVTFSEYYEVFFENIN